MQEGCGAAKMREETCVREDAVRVCVCENKHAAFCLTHCLHITHKTPLHDTMMEDVTDSQGLDDVLPD